jgi:nitroreductase
MNLGHGAGAMSAFEAVTGRRSVRRFLPVPVSEDCILAILAAASRAPSGVNAQPWLVHIVTGAALRRLADAGTRAAAAGPTSLEYQYLPDEMPEPYRSRRRKVGHDLYALYGIDRNDHSARQAVMLRNFGFFGAPVGLFYTMDRRLAAGSWLDMGMFMQNVMTMARAAGLETCPQQAWCDVGAVVHRELGIPDDHILLSGMALGHPDPDALENTLVSERIGPRQFTTIHDV